MPSIWHCIPSLLLLPAYISAQELDCNHIRISGQSFNLEKLGGPKTVHHVVSESPSISNTTFTVDICKKLPKEGDAKKKEDCAQGTRICGKEWDYRPDSSEPFLKRVIEIAGSYHLSHGANRALNPKFTRLKDSPGNDDPDKEGLLMEIGGGKYDGKDQKAIIEFVCDREWKGTEGFEFDEKVVNLEQYQSMRRMADDDEDEQPEPDLPNLDAGKAMEFRSYKAEGEADVLRLRWRTKYACEGARNEKDPEDENKSGGWGFFTWFIIILFLLAASYIIFGSWLNYNRYGARGWDLIPHGDTIRDIPYIVKDWGSNVAGRLKGGDGRGGYSAV